jgi:hypothetical protein
MEASSRMVITPVSKSGSFVGRRSIQFTRIWTMAGAVGLCAACISGPVLRGYPEYPFQTFVVPDQADSVFFDLQPLLLGAGFPLDYTRLDSRLIATRRSDVDQSPLFLSIVVGEEEPHISSRVWVAGYQDTPTGPLRVNPEDETLWARVRQIARQLSASLDGTVPTGPGGEVTPPPVSGTGGEGARNAPDGGS